MIWWKIVESITKLPGKVHEDQTAYIITTDNITKMEFIGVVQAEVNDIFRIYPPKSKFTEKDF